MTDVIEVVELPSRSTRDGSPRWAAAVIEGGRETSFTCTHLHHSPAVAARCVKRTEKAWRTFTAGAPFTERRIVQSEPYTVVELVHHVARLSRRFHYPEEIR